MDLEGEKECSIFMSFVSVYIIKKRHLLAPSHKIFSIFNREFAAQEAATEKCSCARSVLFMLERIKQTIISSKILMFNARDLEGQKKLFIDCAIVTLLHMHNEWESNVKHASRGNQNFLKCDDTDEHRWKKKNPFCCRTKNQRTKSY